MVKERWTESMAEYVVLPQCLRGPVIHYRTFYGLKLALGIIALGTPLAFLATTLLVKELEVLVPMVIHLSISLGLPLFVACLVFALRRKIYPNPPLSLFSRGTFCVTPKNGSSPQKSSACLRLDPRTGDGYVYGCYLVLKRVGFIYVHLKYQVRNPEKLEQLVQDARQSHFIQKNSMGGVHI